MYERYRVVLVRPEEAANIGAVCRAMKTMGLTRLTIVGTEHFRRERIRHVAHNSFELFENARLEAELAPALTGSVLSAGFTRRKGRWRKYISYLPEELAAKCSGLQEGEVALVFGNERTGLTDSELNCCDCAVTIPSSSHMPSLNLSHAVQIACYTLFRAHEKTEVRTHAPITREELEQTVGTIVDAMERIGFFTLTGKQETFRFIRDILARAMIGPKEAERLEAIARKAAQLVLHKR
jgi:tRNA/rRNA methyltransferase